MITPRTKPSSFFPDEAADDLSVVQQRKAKLEGYVQTLAAMDELIDFAAMASAVDKACPRADRSKGGRPPYPTEALVRMVFLQGLYNLSDEQCEHQVLDRLSFQRFCRLDGALNIPDARTLWSFRQRLAEGGLGGRAIFEALSQQGGKCVRAMTLARNALAITLQCAAYNARRLVWLVKSAGASAQPA